MELTINIPPELEDRLQQEATQKGVALEEYARLLFFFALEKAMRGKDWLPPLNRGNGEISKGDAWSVLESMEGTVEGPVDWSSELDHYLYGTPKRNESTR